MATISTAGPAEAAMKSQGERKRAWQHPWLRIERLIRSVLEVRRDEATRPMMKATLVEALKEREKIRRAGWMN